MSVYSRWVEARGTTSIESTPASRHASYPVARSRRGSGPWGEGCGVIEEPPAANHGPTVKPYSDCTARAGTTGSNTSPASVPELVLSPSLSSATTVETRSSVPCTCVTAAAPSEWPMIAMRVVLPAALGRLSGRRSKRRCHGLCASTRSPAPWSG